MSYPASSDVASGQPTASAHYNNLRKDAIYMGNVSADSVNLGTFLQAFILNMNIEYLATARVRVPYDSQKPACVMISGCMLVQTANIDLAAGSVTGAAATYYVFAVRAAGVTSFTLAVNTSAVPAADQRLIGEFYWDGTAIVLSSIYSYSLGGDILEPDYDSDWFAVAHNTLYGKAHGMGLRPRFITLFFAAAAGAGTWFDVKTVSNGTNIGYSIVSCNETNVYVYTGNSALTGVLTSIGTTAGSGYYRILAWS